LDRVEFYPDDLDHRVNFESPGSFATVWVAFPYDRPDRLNIFSDDWDDPDDPDDYMETRLKENCFFFFHSHAEKTYFGLLTLKFLFPLIDWLWQ